MLEQTSSGGRFPALSNAPSEASSSRRVFNWSAAVLALVILGLGLWTAVSTARSVRSTYSPVSYWDQWTVVDVLQAENGVLPLSGFWAQHNEHRILVGRLAFLADMKFFHGRNASLLVEIFLIQLSLALLFTWMCGYFGNFGRPALVTIAGFFCFCIFCPLQIENFYWGFQVSFVFAGLAAAVSFACVVWHAARVAKGTATWISGPLLLAFLAGFLAEGSLADGLIVWPVMVWLAYSLRLEKRTQGLCLLVGLLAIGLYFIGYHSPSEQVNPLKTMGRPLDLARFVLTYFGSSWDSTLPSSSSSLEVSELLTASAIVFALGNAAWSVLVRPPAPNLLRSFLIANLLLTIVAAMLTSLGRLNFGMAEAAANRYQSIALVFWAALAALIVASIPRQLPRGLTLALTQVVLIALMISTFGRFAKFFRQAENHQIALNSAYAALDNNPSSASLSALNPDPDKVLGWYNFMRSHDLGPDPREFYNWGGYQQTAASDCLGSLDVIQPVSANQQSAVGWAWDLTAKRAARNVVLVSPRGVIVGTGEVDVPRQDVQAVMKVPDLITGWTAEVHAARGSQVRAFAVLADKKSICPLNGELRAP